MTPSKRLALINGANLNLLGKRETAIYGTTTLDDIQKHLTAIANAHGIELICQQSNHEGCLVDFIGAQGVLADMPFDGVIINPAAFTHQSVAIRDALAATAKPFIEVHLSNIHRREPFRHHSYFSDQAVGVICGLGALGYEMALRWFIEHWQLNERID